MIHKKCDTCTVAHGTEGTEGTESTVQYCPSCQGPLPLLFVVLYVHRAEEGGGIGQVFYYSTDLGSTRIYCSNSNAC